MTETTHNSKPAASPTAQRTITYGRGGDVVIRKGVTRTFVPGDLGVTRCVECGATFALRHVGQTCCTDRHERRVANRLARCRSLSWTNTGDSIGLWEVGNRDRWHCYLCRQPVSATADHYGALGAMMDHVESLHDGGTHTFANVRLAHRACSRFKGHRFTAEETRAMLAPTQVCELANA